MFLLQRIWAVIKAFKFFFALVLSTQMEELCNMKIMSYELSDLNTDPIQEV